MSTPLTPGTAAGNSPAVPVEQLTRWLVVLDVLAEDVRFRLDHHGIELRLHDLADDMTRARQQAGGAS